MWRRVGSTESDGGCDLQALEGSQLGEILRSELGVMVEALCTNVEIFMLLGCAGSGDEHKNSSKNLNMK